MGAQVGKRGDRKMDKKYIFLLLLLAVFLVVQITQPHDQIPAVSSGNAHVFYDQGRERNAITEVDATEDRIYVLFSQIGVVETYDWNGVYQFSVAVYCKPEGHGSCRIRCEGDRLYVQDQEDNVIVLEGDQILEKMESTEFPHPNAWFHESDERVKQQGLQITDAEGHFIMDLPGIGETEQCGRRIFTAVLMVSAAAIIFWPKGKKRQEAADYLT